MIDLSFLTEEEQGAILAVLKRDAELKKAEEHRVQKLQTTVGDRGQLRYLTGEWFYETKQLRHQDRIHGSDIIRASMRHTHKPLTILELSQMLPEQPSFVDSENRDVFVPPVLCGLLEEPHTQRSDERFQNQNPSDPSPHTPKAVLQSPTKRENPFNSELNAHHTFEQQDGQLSDEDVDHSQKLNEAPLPSSDSSISCATNLQPDACLVSQNADSVPVPIPENTAVANSQDCFVEVDGAAGRETNCAAPRGILKHLSTSSSTDSLLSPLDLQSPVSPDSPTETWMDRKQVKFSSMVSQSGEEWQNGKELGEHSLLDNDSIAPSEMENSCLNNSYLDNTDSTATDTQILNQSGVDLQEGGAVRLETEANQREQEAGRHQVLGDVSGHRHSERLNPVLCSPDSAEPGKPVHLETEPEEDHHSQAQATDHRPTRHDIHQHELTEQSTHISVEATSDTKPPTSVSSESSSHALSPKPGQRSLGIFSRAKEKRDGLQSSQMEEVKLEGKEPVSIHLSQGPADMAVDRPASFKLVAKPFEVTEARTPQLAAPQNTSFKETVITEYVDTQQDATEGKAVEIPERLSNLKAFSEEDYTGPKTLFTREETRQQDMSKTGTEASHGPQTYVESLNNVLVQKEISVDDTSENILSPQTECILYVDLSKEDGTYRANPVLIYEETDDSLTGSVTDFQENIIIPVPSSVAFNAQKQWEGDPVSLPRQSDSSPQEDRPAKITELKHFWETEYTGTRVITAKMKEASRSAIPSEKGLSPQSDLRTPLDNREKSEGEGQMSPHKAKSNIVLKSLKVTDKGFVSQSPDRSPVRSAGPAIVALSTDHRHQGKVDTEPRERPLGPSKSQIPRSKEQDNEVRMSPSKTCHPRVLPRESSSPKRSRLEASPLKTFPIDINPQTKVAEEQHRKPSPVPGQKKSPSHGAKQTVVTERKPSTDITSGPIALHKEDGGAYYDSINTQHCNSSPPTSPQSKTASENKLGTFANLARSFIPQDHQYYLGPQEKAHVPPFHPDKCVAEEADAVHSPQSFLRDFEGNQGDDPTEGTLTRISSWIVQTKDGNSSQETTTRAGSLSRASSGSELLNSLSIYFSSRS